MALKNELRKLDPFQSIHVHGYSEVSLNQTTDLDQPLAVEIEADESLLPMVTCKVRDGRLRVGFDAPWWDVGSWIAWAFLPEKRMHLKITFRELRDFTFSGSGSAQAHSIQVGDCRFRLSGSVKLTLEELHAAGLSTDISGSAEVQISGAAEQHIVTVSGTGRVDAERLSTKTTRVRISGSGKARVDASGQLQVYISGSGTVDYRGKPVLLKRISGAGSVRPINEE